MSGLVIAHRFILFRPIVPHPSSFRDTMMMDSERSCGGWLAGWHEPERRKDVVAAAPGGSFWDENESTIPGQMTARVRGK